MFNIGMNFLPKEEEIIKEVDLELIKKLPDGTIYKIN